jgi:hypothetical protein
MIARVARFEGVNAQQAESTFSEAEEIIRPLVEGLPGYQGSLALMSPEGTMMSITFFDSEENAEAAEPTFDEEMPRRLGELFQGEWEGRRVAVDRYNVMSDERR